MAESNKETKLNLAYATGDDITGQQDDKDGRANNSTGNNTGQQDGKGSRTNASKGNAADGARDKEKPVGETEISKELQDLEAHTVAKLGDKRSHIADVSSNDDARGAVVDSHEVDSIVAGIQPLPLPHPARRDRAYNFSLPGAYALSSRPRCAPEVREATAPDSSTSTDNGAAMQGRVLDNHEGLAVALAVDEDEEKGRTLALEEATEVEPNVRNKKEDQFFYYTIGCAFLLLVFLAVIVVLSLTSDSQSKTTAPTPTLDKQVSIESTMVPSAAPTIFLHSIFNDLSDQTQQQLQIFGTPQWKAWDWLSGHKNITNLSTWRQEQLFAMAVFFYSFDGENWPPPLRERWMDDNREECLWYSAGTGQYNLDGEYITWESLGFPSRDPCNEDGRLTSLWLSFNMTGLVNVSVPEELYLLTALENLELQTNVPAPLPALLPPLNMDRLTKIDIQSAYLSGTIPSELGGMTNLTKFAIGQLDTLVEGTIPSEVGLLTNLNSLFLMGGKMASTIPTEIGSLTNLTWFDAALCGLEGNVPSELGLLTRLTTLSLWNNSFADGGIPSEIGELSDLETLWLFTSRIGGTLPSELGQLKRLQTVYLFNNTLTGPIPSEVGNMAALADVRLDLNYLSGTLPKTMATNFSWRLEGNQFTGMVPESLCSYLYCQDCSSASTCDSLASYAEYPGRFPFDEPVFDNSTNAIVPIMLNIMTDAWPMNTEWNLKQFANESETWYTIAGVDQGDLEIKNYLYSVPFELAPEKRYRLEVVDTFVRGRFVHFPADGYVTVNAFGGEILYSVQAQSFFVPSFSNLTLDFVVSTTGNVTLDVTETLYEW